MKKIPIFVLSLMLCGCASWDAKSTRTTLQAFGKIAGVAASIYFPEYTPAIQAVCAAAGSSSQDLMVNALQQLWTDADQKQATEVVGAINAIVGESKVLDGNMTSAQLNEMQTVLGEVCCAVKPCK